MRASNHLKQPPTATNTSNPQKDPLSLNVSISKQIGSFSLKVTFQTADSLLSILGESGAGKSLLLRCLAGIETPDSGRIVLGEQILFDSQQQINVPSCDRNIALLFQNYALFPHLTVAQNISFGIQKKAGETTQTIKITVEKELAAVGMSEFAHRYPQHLSGGQQQRIALARALAAKPQMLLLDEPFSALDTHLRSHLSQQLFQRLHTYRGITLLVTHNLTEAYRAEQLVVLNQGKAVQQGVPANIFEWPKTEATARLTGPCNLSPAQLQDTTHLYAQHWQMALRLSKIIPQNLAQKQYSIGIRPQNISFITLAKYRSQQPPQKTPDRMASPNMQSAPLLANQANCWPTHHWQLPDSVVVLVKLHQPAHSPDDYHLQVVLPHQTWQQQQQQPLPWTVYLPSHHLIVLRP